MPESVAKAYNFGSKIYIIGRWPRRGFEHRSLDSQSYRYRKRNLQSEMQINQQRIQLNSFAFLSWGLRLLVSPKNLNHHVSHIQSQQGNATIW